MTSPISEHDSPVAPSSRPVGGGALGLALVAILLLVGSLPFLFLIFPALGFGVWAIALGARSLKSGDHGGSAVSAITGIVLGSLVCVFTLYVLLALSLLEG